jgi:hypothetical protein
MDLFPLKLPGGSICSFKRIIHVLRLVQVHVHSIETGIQVTEV